MAQEASRYSFPYLYDESQETAKVRIVKML
jgi:hypothetical protein